MKQQAISGQTRRPGAVASRWLLVVAVTGAALAVGTIHTITLCLVAAVLAAAAVCGWWGAEPMRARTPATVLLITGLGLTVYTALQCVPLPISWLATIAPHNADVWSRALSPLHEPGPRWAPISLDPVATRVEVLRGVAYLLAFLTALRVARTREGVRVLGGTVVATALVLAIAAVLHPAFGARTLFGLYEAPTSIAARHVAPLMNANNLAGYLNLAICLAFASLVAPEPHIPRPIAGATVALLASAQVWIGSRGGLATMGLGLVVVASMARITRIRHAGTVPVVALVAGAAVVAAVSMFVLSGSNEAAGELMDTDMSKLRMFGESMRCVPSMPFLGCGRGAFESAFPAFRVEPGYTTYSHPENVVAQWIVEWGVPVGAIGLTAMAFALRPKVVLARSSSAAGAWAGLVALGVQNMGDLGTEIPGLTLSGVVCAAIVVAGSSGRVSARVVEQWPTRPRAVAVVAGGLAILAVLSCSGVLWEGLHDDRQAMHRAAFERPTSAEAMAALARSTMLRHPAEPYLPFVTAVRAANQHDEDPIPWLGATLERARIYGPAHMILARVIAARSPSQARLEYRLAMEQAPNLINEVMPEASRVVNGYYDALEVIPVGKERARAGDLLVLAVSERLPSTGARLDADLVLWDRLAAGPLWRNANRLVQDLESGELAPWCQGNGHERCTKVALTLTETLESMSPDQCEGYVLHARARAATGDSGGAIAELDGATAATDDSVLCLQEIVTIARASGDSPRTERALDRIAAMPCTGLTTCVEYIRWAGQQYEAMGRARRALSIYRRALEMRDDDSLLAHMARLAAEQGGHVESAADYNQLARRHPDEPEWLRLAAEQHEAALREAAKL